MTSKYEGYSFKLNENVTRTKVKFHNRYGIELAGDLYVPKNAEGKLSAIAVAGPFGAVKEQAVACMPTKWLQEVLSLSHLTRRL